MFDTVPWETLKQGMQWRQGEHLAAIAPTGAGKTTLMSELMPMRKYNLMFGTKPADKTYDKILAQGYQRIESIDEVRSYHHNYLLWPRQRKTIPETVQAQRESFITAMNTIVKQGSWTVWADESKYMAEMLGLKGHLTYLLEQARSINVTMICGAQRPAFLPLSVLSNSTHIFLWKTLLDTDQKRLADIGGIDSKQVMSVAKTLGKYEFLYIHTRGTDARIVRSQVRK